MQPREGRQISMFVSSTFQDLTAERDYLVKKVFPSLRQMAAARNVVFVPIDLRWGITEEESHTGKVIEVCLDEIDRCRPFFVGIIADRYGWQPNNREFRENPLLLEKHPWLETEIGQDKSVTEIEMDYAALKKNNKNAVFFFKESDKKCEDVRVARLKAKIRSLYPEQTYSFSTAEQLGGLLEQVFMTELDKRYEPRSLTSHERMKLVQQTFHESLIQGYVPSENGEGDFSVLNSYANQMEKYHRFLDHQLCVVSDETNIGGCSAVVANWAKNYQGKSNIVLYSVEASLQGNSLNVMIQYLIDEVSDLYAEKVPSEMQSFPLYRQFHQLLYNVRERQPLVVIIDGLNHLDYSDKSLQWLPQPNGNVVMVYTTDRNDITFKLMERSDSPVWTLWPVDYEMRADIVRNYLAVYGKRLTDKQVFSIARWAPSYDMHMLRMLLDELVGFGSHERLGAFLEHYLDHHQKSDFLYSVITRYRHDFMRPTVDTVLSVLYQSYGGLSEEEITGITGINTYKWSRFYLAFIYQTERAEDLIRLKPMLRSAMPSVLNEYDLKHASKQIVCYFAGRTDVHAMTELIKQYLFLKQYRQLHQLLSRSDVFEALFPTHPSLLHEAWLALRNTNSDSIFGALLGRTYDFKGLLHYQGDNDDSSKLAHYYDNVSELVFAVTGDESETYPFVEKAARYMTDSEQMGLIAMKQRRFSDAVDHFERSKEQIDKLERLLGPCYIASFDNCRRLSKAYAALREFDKARQYMQQAISIIEQAEGPASFSLTECRNYMASFLSYEGKDDEAIQLLLKYLNEDVITFATLDTYRLLEILYKHTGQTECSEEYRQKAISGARLLFGPNHPFAR